MSSVDDLVKWLRAQLDDDERVAQRVEPNQAPNELRAMVTRDGSQPFLVIDSARVLAEVDAKRRILKVIRDMIGNRPTEDDGWWPGIAQQILDAYALRLAKAEALPYVDRPGYRKEWSPDAY